MRERWGWIRSTHGPIWRDTGIVWRIFAGADRHAAIKALIAAGLERGAPSAPRCGRSQSRAAWCWDFREAGHAITSVGVSRRSTKISTRGLPFLAASRKALAPRRGKAAHTPSTGLP